MTTWTVIHTNDEFVATIFTFATEAAAEEFVAARGGVLPNGAWHVDYELVEDAS